MRHADDGCDRASHRPCVRGCRRLSCSSRCHCCEMPRISAAQARSGPAGTPARPVSDWRSTATARSSLQPQQKLARRQRVTRPVHRTSPRQRCGAKQIAAARQQSGIQRITDEADPAADKRASGPGAMPAAPIMMPAPSPMRVDRDFHGDGDDQRDAGRQAKGDEDARQCRRNDDLADAVAPAIAAARGRLLSAAARCCAPRRATEDQDRPDTGKGDDHDFHPIAEAERDQRDR